MRIFLFIFLLCSELAYSQNNKEEKLIYPLHVLMKKKGNYVPILNQKQYMESLNSQVLDSILSPKKLWSIQNSEKQKIKVYEYRDQFYEEWYIKRLPLLIWSDKLRNIANRDILIYYKNYYKLHNLLDEKKTLKQRGLISFTNQYNYTSAEKLNLFLFLLHNNISDKNLLTLWKAWEIDKYPIVYIKDSKKYINNFFETMDVLGLKDMKKQNLINWFNKENQFIITSVLHQAVRHNKSLIFNEIIKNNLVDINLKNYLEQTALHIATDKEWSEGKSYIDTLLKKPNILINIQDFKGWAPFSYIVYNSRNNSFSGVIEFLKQNENRVKLDLLDKDRKNLILLAGERGLPKVADYLYEQAGAPWPDKVSLSNTYIDSNYTSTFFQYQTDLNLDHLVGFLYDSTDVKEGKFNILNTEENAKYHILLDIVQNILEQTETARHNVIMSFLSHNIEKEWSEELRQTGEIDFLASVVKAIYKGDTLMLDQLLSSTNKKDINKFLFYQQFNITDDRLKPILKELPFWNHNYLIQKKSTKDISIEVSSFLSEAVRANQPKVVEFLLKKGANPVSTRNNSIIGNDIMTAILSVVFFYDNEKAIKDHKSIVNMLINHPSVTKDFLNKEVLPQLNYADLAAVRGHLPALKAMYKKGARVSDGFIWNGNMSIDQAVVFSEFLEMAKFLYQEKIKEAKTPEDKKMFEDQLNNCQKVFH